MRFPPVYLVLPWLLTACAPLPPAPRVTLERTGLIQAWPDGLMDAKGKPAHFESSAVVWSSQRDTVFIASDKPSPRADVSNVISVPLSALLGTRKVGALNKALDNPAPVRSRSASSGAGNGIVPRSQVHQVSGSSLNRAAKLESMTTLGSDLCLAMSSFDRDEDAFNSVVVWRASDPASAQVVNPTTRNGVTSSISLREPIRRALVSAKWPAGPPYFKIEGMTVMRSPGTTVTRHSDAVTERLILGVREYGKSYKTGEFQYAVRLIEGTIKIGPAGRVSIGSEFKPLLSVSASLLRRQGIQHTVAISSLEADHDGTLWALLSYEEGDGAAMGAYLLRLREGRAGFGPGAKARVQVAVRPDGRAFEFPHKAEGLSFLGQPRCGLSPSCALIIADEDRRLAPVNTSGGVMTRTPSQCVFGVLRISP